MSIHVEVLPSRNFTDETRAALQSRLKSFYDSVTDYSAFNEAVDQSNCWEFIGESIRQRLALSSPGTRIRILEVGAGRSGFGEWLRAVGLRERVSWLAQDVTPQNAGYLSGRADAVHVGSVHDPDLRGPFDIIFSTYVLEHVTDPEQHLEALARHRATGGSIFVFCPRYDAPGYMCPSSRHLVRSARRKLFFQVLGFRLQSLLLSKPAFLIQTDLAAFHVPFFTDADAVHWVSMHDLNLWARRKGLSLRHLKIGHPRFPSKDWIVKRLLACAVEIRESSGV